MSSIFSAYNPLEGPLWFREFIVRIWILEFLEFGNFSTLMQTEVRCGLFILHFI